MHCIINLIVDGKMGSRTVNLGETLMLRKLYDSKTAGRLSASVMDVLLMLMSL